MRIELRVVATVAIATIGILLTTDGHAQVCPVKDSTNNFNAAGLVALVPVPPAPLTGVVSNTAGTAVELANLAGNFASTPSTLPGGLAVPAQTVAVLDINGDSWDDIITASRYNHGLKVHLNDTMSVAAPADWSTAGTIRTPQFTATGLYVNATGDDCSIGIVGGDFDGDALEDVVLMGCTSTATQAIAKFELHRNDGADSFLPAVAAHGAPGNLGIIDRSTSSMVATDWNGDGCLDILIGTDATRYANADSQVIAMINDCTGVFTDITLLTGLDFAGDGGATNNGGPALALADFDNDGFQDLMVSAASASNITSDGFQLYLGDGAGGFGSKIALAIPIGDAHVQGFFALDLNNDNAPDIAWTVDDKGGANAGARGKVGVWYNDNDGVGHPFQTSTPLAFQATGLAGTDLDSGVLIDYDHDPHQTKDIFVTEADTPPSLAAGAMLVNRHDTRYADCGEISSNIIPITAPPAEYVISGARLAVTDNIPGVTSIRYFASNVDPPIWVEASTPCSLAPTTDYCVTFPATTGTTLRWRALMCTTDDTVTPNISSVNVTADYVPASTQFRAGVVTSNGVVYAGGFSAPGDRGKFSALSTDFSSPTTFWEAHTELDSDLNPLVADRKIYTADRATGDIRIDFVTGTAPGPDTLPETLNVATGAIADALVTWWHSKRFGAGAPFSRLGAIVNSTAAVLTAPGLPVHYSFLLPAEQTTVDTFIDANKDREGLVFFGSKDGAIHAIHTNPTISPLVPGVENGREEWAFIPAPIASELRRDQASATPDLRAFPDGPPSIADVFDGSTYITVMVASGGSGSSAVWALDITDTLNGAPAIDGPDPLWHKVIENAGKAFAKPAIMRLDNATAQGKFQAVLATGLSGDDLPDDAGGAPPLTPHVKGRRVVGVDIATGVEQWYFDAVCAVTSDLTVFETDDAVVAPFGTASTIDGFADRLVFADYCGYVYMIDLNNLPVTVGGLASGLGAIDTLVLDDAAVSIKALFWTGDAAVPAPLGSNERRPIAGGIAARADDSTNVVLYFGTGGLQEFTPTKENVFYAVYANTGAIRSRLAAPCPSAGKQCPKFFGGTVTTATQVIISQSTDPEVGATTCDTGSSVFTLADLSDENANGLFDDSQAILTYDSGSVGAVFAANNAVYITTLDGSIAQIGQPSVTTPGSDTTQASSATDTIKGEYMATSGWRQVFY